MWETSACLVVWRFHCYPCLNTKNSNKSFKYFVLEYSKQSKLRMTTQADVSFIFNSWNVCFTNNRFVFFNEHLSYLQLQFDSRLNMSILFEQMRPLKTQVVMKIKDIPKFYYMNAVSLDSNICCSKPRIVSASVQVLYYLYFHGY